MSYHIVFPVPSAALRASPRRMVALGSSVLYTLCPNPDTHRHFLETLLAAVEVFRLLPPAGFPVQLLPGAVLPPLLVLAMGLDIVDAGWVAVYAAAVLVVLAIDAFRRPEVRDGFLVDRSADDKAHVDRSDLVPCLEVGAVGNN